MFLRDPIPVDIPIEGNVSNSSCAHPESSLRLRMLRGAQACALLLLTACAGAVREATVVADATAPEPIRQDLEFKLDPGQPVRIDNPYGSVYLRFGGYEHQLGLHSTLQQPADAAEIRFAPAADATGFLIAPRLPEGSVLARGQRFDLVVYVPQQHAVQARTIDGAIDARGLKSDLDLHTDSGAVAARGTEGLLQIETDSGAIEAAFAAAAPTGSVQRLATRTGAIIVGVSDALAADVSLASSAPFTTDYSLVVTHRDGEEPNKTAKARIGTPDAAHPAVLQLHSLRGDIRLLRRAVYVEAETTAGAAPSG